MLQRALPAPRSSCCAELAQPRPRIPYDCRQSLDRSLNVAKAAGGVQRLRSPLLTRRSPFDGTHSFQCSSLCD